jgi:hypothetical protein
MATDFDVTLHGGLGSVGPVTLSKLQIGLDAIELKKITAGLDPIELKKLTVGLDPIELKKLTIGLDPIELKKINVGLDPLEVKLAPIKLGLEPIDLRLTQFPSIRAHLPADFHVGISFFGHEIIGVRLCGEAQAITEPYVPNPCERCEAPAGLPALPG